MCSFLCLSCLPCVCYLALRGCAARGGCRSAACGVFCVKVCFMPVAFPAHACMCQVHAHLQGVQQDSLAHMCVPVVPCLHRISRARGEVAWGWGSTALHVPSLGSLVVVAALCAACFFCLPPSAAAAQGRGSTQPKPLRPRGVVKDGMAGCCPPSQELVCWPAAAPWQCTACCIIMHGAECLPRWLPASSSTLHACGPVGHPCSFALHAHSHDMAHLHAHTAITC